MTDKWECINGFWTNTETGEVSEHCFTLTEAEQDHDLEHYSVLPPVPYVPTKYKERMKELNKWLKGKEKWIDLKMRFYKKLKYVLK